MMLHGNEKSEIERPFTRSASCKLLLVLFQAMKREKIGQMGGLRCITLQFERLGSQGIGLYKSN